MYVNSEVEVEQVEEAEGRRWDKEHDEWRMLLENEDDDDERNLRVVEHEMIMVLLNVDVSH